MAGLTESDTSLALRSLLGASARGARVVTALPSKKSRAFLIEADVGDHGPCREGDAWAPASLRLEPLVLKIYQAPGPAEREAAVLAELARAGVTAPRLVKASDIALLRSYTVGPVARDLHCGTAFTRSLARWLHLFHRTLAQGAPHRTWLVGDMNLGNFVIDVACGQVCGIDFGDSREGNPMDDVGEGCMRIVSHRPGFTMDRWASAVAFVREYGGLAGAEEKACRDVVPFAVRAFERMSVWREDRVMADMALAFPQLWASAVDSCASG
ncbi:MAG: hypothetical protein VB144_01725 [Clostridia bacterium]|nr:hypothetical protein [Clostridia bacterium]